jgi:hypothetical protein
MVHGHFLNEIKEEDFLSRKWRMEAEGISENKEKIKLGRKWGYKNGKKLYRCKFYMKCPLCLGKSTEKAEKINKRTIRNVTVCKLCNDKGVVNKKKLKKWEESLPGNVEDCS